jgi:hypothetical protein
LHNGSLIPVPGRDIMVQAWYQGGISVVDFTNPHNPQEIAFFDRGPVDGQRLYLGGHWSAYWYNGYVYGSEIARGLDVLQLSPSEFLSKNELDAAMLVRFDEFNPQMQPRFVWPASFAVARSYVDQMTRGNGMSADKLAKLSRDLDAAEKLAPRARRTALTRLAAYLHEEVATAQDQKRVLALGEAVRKLAGIRN